MEVTVTGLGGEGILRTYGQKDESSKVILEAIARGITYFNCARAYACSETCYGQVWSKHPEYRAGIFQAATRGKTLKLRAERNRGASPPLRGVLLWTLGYSRSRGVEQTGTGTHLPENRFFFDGRMGS